MTDKILHAAKIALAAIIAIVLADLFKLEYSVSAGIVAILSVAFTKRETIQTAINRFLAFVVALVIAGICFNTIGYNTYGFFVYLLLFILVCQFLGWNSAMAMDSVLISHFLSFKCMDLHALTNEMGLFLIGVGIGIIANIFLRENKDYMRRMERETDDLIKLALHRMSLRIMDPKLPDYDGRCFDTLRETLDEAAALARMNYMNRWSKKEMADIEYIAMREKQADILYEIYKHLSRIETVPVTAELLSRFFEDVSTRYPFDDSVDELLQEFGRLDLSMKEMPLPVERKEFEDRARLFAIMRGMEEFLRETGNNKQ